MHAYPFTIPSRHVSFVAPLLICVAIILGSVAALTTVVPFS